MRSVYSENSCFSWGDLEEKLDESTGFTLDCYYLHSVYPSPGYSPTIVDREVGSMNFFTGFTDPPSELKMMM
jgi:hypothetical protein